MAVTEASREAYERVRDDLNHSQAAVLAMIEELGPCHNNRLLEALQQADKAKPRRQRRPVAWVSNNAWPRVTELMMLRVVVNMGKFRGVWNGRACSMNFHRVSGDDRSVPPGWVKVDHKEKAERTIKYPKPAEPKALEMAASAAGRRLREWRRVKGRKVTAPTKQLIFNFGM